MHVNTYANVEMLFKSLLLLLCGQLLIAKRGFGPTDQDWGYEAVRHQAYLFWWLHYTTANVIKHTDRPLIIWLQGGPGASSTGYGYFGELGPLDTDLKPRNSTWVKWANVLFVDNPVGTGFGYVNHNKQLTRNNTQIANDFLVFLKKFLQKLPEFKRVPLYIFCESYGGKMTAEIALVIYQARKNGKIEVNLKGIALGDSWISPVNSILDYAPYLLSVGQIDKIGYDRIMKVANKVKIALDKGDSNTAGQQWSAIIQAIEDSTYGVNMYNILKKMSPYARKLYQIQSEEGLYNLTYHDVDLNKIMNEKVKPALNISNTWLSVNLNVFNALCSDFMNPVTNIVERILNETDITVAVYNGQLDLIVNTLGTNEWINNLHFTDKALWDAAPRNGFTTNKYYQGYVKKYGKFAFYWVDRSGHMVPEDNPSAMHYILKDVTDNFKV